MGDWPGLARPRPPKPHTDGPWSGPPNVVFSHRSMTPWLVLPPINLNPFLIPRGQLEVQQQAFFGLPASTGTTACLTVRRLDTGPAANGDMV